MLHCKTSSQQVPLQSSSEGLKSFFSWIAMTTQRSTPEIPVLILHVEPGAAVIRKEVRRCCRASQCLEHTLVPCQVQERFLLPRWIRPRAFAYSWKTPTWPQVGQKRSQVSLGSRACPVCEMRRQVLYCSGNSTLPPLGSGRNFPLGKNGTGPWQVFAFLCSIEHVMVRFPLGTRGQVAACC